MTIELANLELTPKKWVSIQKLARKSNTNAMYLTGVAYMLGGLVDIDSKKAYFWFKKAADKGHADAAFRNGFLLQHRSVVDETQTPFQWYEKAANMGSGAALCALGNTWTFDKLKQQRWWHRWIGGADNSDSAQNAVAHYKKALEKEYAAANYFLGVHHLKGWGIPKDKAKALSFFEEGLALKDKDSALAIALAQPYNSTSYWHYLEQAADWGHAQAQFKLALAFTARRTVSSDEQAMMWLRKASIQRYPKAMLLLSRTLASERSGRAPNYMSAYRWARRCASIGGCTQSWVDILFSKLNEAEKLYALNENDVDDKEFHELSQKLFGTAGM